MLNAFRPLATIAVTSWVAVGFLLSWPSPVIAAEPSPDEIIIESGVRCEARLREHLEKAEAARMKANVLLIAGTSLAALGGALAAFLKKEALRKVTGLAGALGAVLAIIPKTLDDPATFRALYVKAERHRDIAIKIHRQLGLVDPSKRAALTQYVIARLADCESGEPSEKPPEPALPDSGVLLAVVPMTAPPVLVGGRSSYYSDWLNSLVLEEAHAIPEDVTINWDSTVAAYRLAVEDQDWSKAVGKLGRMMDYLRIDAWPLDYRRQHWRELRQLALLVPRRDLLPASLRPVEP